MGDAVKDDDLKKNKGGLKKVTTKAGDGGPSAQDVAYFAKIYTDNGGDLSKIAAQMKVKFKDGATVKDAEDFAKQVLSGIILAE